jgi:hypothetical protein
MVESSWNSQDYANYRYKKRVSKIFRKRSGLDSYDFKVLDPWLHPYEFVEMKD